MPRYCFVAVVSLLATSGVALRVDADELPPGVPPLMGTAVVQDSEADLPQANLVLTMPRDSWKAVRPVMPQRDWPKLKQTVKQGTVYEGTMLLPLGSQPQPALYRIVDTQGKELTAQQISQQLKSKQPVLVSVTGQMPDRCYIDLTSPAKVIILLGPEAKQQGSDESRSDTKVSRKQAREEEDWKGTTERESQAYFFGLMQKAQSFKIKTKEEAAEYMKGIWRLDKRAHIGGGHYVRADRGEDLAVICTDKWLVVRALSEKAASDMSVARFNSIVPDGQFLVVKGEGSISFDRYQPLDENHMAVLNYDFIAVVKRVPCETAKPEQEDNTSDQNASQ